MKIDDQKLKEILLKENYVAADALQAAEAFAKKTRGTIVEYLLTERLITNDLLGQAIAEAFNVPYADLNHARPPLPQVMKIPEAVAAQFRAVLFAEDEKKITIATDDPVQAAGASQIKNLFPGKTITIAYSLPEDIDATFIHYRKPLETRFAKIIEGKKRVAPEILDEIFEDALDLRASDIHFEPREDGIIIRFRIDGVLLEAGRLLKENYENILNRIKVMAHLRIDEHFAAQDGSMRHTGHDRHVDLRVSVVPTIDGEKVVIRILAVYVKGLTLADVGLTPASQTYLEEAAHKPFGMILVTGPTGSGKTTTLYAVLKLLNQSGVNITTIEDPVEYRISGINQIQVNPQTNLTFAQGLRSIVRQDPDIILVGEIRDEETAQIAVNAALTGHILLSTFHANDAPTAMPRLLDMGIEPFLLASTLEVVVAQRLVRKICERCRETVSTTPDDFKKYGPIVCSFFKEDTAIIFAGKGCTQCNNTGFSGRTAIFEIVRNTPAMQNLILQNPATQQIWKLAREEGTQSFFEDGIEKVRSGLTTLPELLRVTAPPEDILVAQTGHANVLPPPPASAPAARAASRKSV